MNKLILLVQAVKALAPIVRAGMEIAQAMLPEKGKGAERLEILKGFVQHAVDVEKVVEAKFAEVWPIVLPSIAPTVAALKALGILKSTPVPALTAPGTPNTAA